MANKKREWKGVTGGSVFGQKAMKIMLAILDVRIGYGIVALVVPFYMLFAHKGYIAIYQYFRLRMGYSPVKAFCKTYMNHFVFGQTIIDRFAVYAGRKNFKVENPDGNLFLEQIESPKSCIIATSHVGNPELCGYLLSQRTKRINGLIFGGETSEVKKNRSTVLTANNVRLIPVSPDMSHLFIINQAFADGEILVVPCDRTFGSDKTVECDFIGGKADFPVGAFALAQQFDLPVLVMFVVKISTSTYRIHIRPIRVADDTDKHKRIEAMTRSFASNLEDIVKKYPEQWFNYYNFWKR